jgi:hypothetical protein
MSVIALAVSAEELAREVPPAGRSHAEPTVGNVARLVSGTLLIALYALFLATSHTAERCRWRRQHPRRPCAPTP